LICYINQLRIPAAISFDIPTSGFRLISNKLILQLGKAVALACSMPDPHIKNETRQGGVTRKIDNADRNVKLILFANW
jgi:hypothetical protein